MRAVVERAIAGACLVVLSPVFAMVACLIWLESGSPVFFRQLRIGRGGSTFRLLKFRSMRTDGSGARITAAGDSRITRSGAFLRNYKIDELPQLWNILLGHMQFIGPRPEVPAFVNPQDVLWKSVLQVKPGLTDLASLVYRDEESVLQGHADPEQIYRRSILPDKLALSARYQAARSLRSDLAIAGLTVRCSMMPSTFDSGRIRKIFENRV